jgi:hypothetical protein
MFEKHGACARQMVISISAEKDRRERGQRYKRGEPTTVGEVHNLLFQAFMSVKGEGVI